MKSKLVTRRTIPKRRSPRLPSPSSRGDRHPCGPGRALRAGSPGCGSGRVRGRGGAAFYLPTCRQRGHGTGPPCSGDALRVCPARGWRETCAPGPPEVSAARGKGGEERALRRERGTKIGGMKARSSPTRAGLPPQGAQSAAPVSAKKKLCCSKQGRFPSPSLLPNLRPARHAPWQRRTPEHGERRWASPLDCLGCRLFVFNSAAATVWGHRGGQTPPEVPGPAARLAKARGCAPALEGAPGERGDIILPSHCRQNAS